MPELASLALRARDRPAVDDEDAPDADLDREVEDGPCSSRASAPCLGQARKRCIVSGDERQSSKGARDESVELDVAPPQRRSLYEPGPRDGARDGNSDRGDPRAEGAVQPGRDPADLGEGRGGSACAVAVQDLHDASTELDGGDAPAVVDDLGRAHDGPARMRGEETRGASASERPGRRLLGQEVAGPQTRGDLGHRAAAQAEDRGGLGPRDPGLLVDESKHGERTRGALIGARAGAARAAHDLLIYSRDEEKRSVRCS